MKSTSSQMPRVSQLNNNLQTPVPIWPRMKRSMPRPPSKKLNTQTKRCLLTSLLVDVDSVIENSLKFDFGQLYHNMLRCDIMMICGRVAEWLKAHAWKACKGATSSQVRILSLPPF